MNRKTGDAPAALDEAEQKIRDSIRDVRRSFFQAIMALSPSGLSILVVDDEPDIREAVQDLMETELAGARVLGAESGAQAMGILRQERVDLIVTDYKMPGMSGVKLLEEAHQVAPGIPHIILTAFDRELIRELGASAQRERIVQKPFEPETLLSLVEAALGAVPPTISV